MSQESSIEISGLVKRFRREILQSEYTTWKTLLLRPFQRSRGKEFVTVLDGIDFSVQPGSTLALIGQNGSGKSTLLKIMAGIYRPDAGQVSVRGRVSSLIELGAGFHPEFTGRENIFINGTILGLPKKEIAKRFDQIAAYSGLGDYIDAPVRTYSSGMYVRLGFSVAVNVDPDVLLVDEVLAVGDEAFAHKCEDKINQFRRQGKTIVLVTHDMTAVKKYADEVIWLDGGRIAERGDPKMVIDAYRQKVAESEDEIRRDEVNMGPAFLDQKRWGSGEVEIEQVRLIGHGGRERAVFVGGDPLTVQIDYHLIKPVADDLVFGLAFYNAAGVLCWGGNSLYDGVEAAPPPRGTVNFEVPRMDLVQGTYFIDVAAHGKDSRPFDYIKQVTSFAVRNKVIDEGVFRPPHQWRITPRSDAQ